MAAPATSASSIPSASLSSPTSSKEDSNSKPTYSSKLGGAKSKLDNGVTAVPQKQPTPQKAWGSGNTLTQRLSTTQNNRNGAAVQQNSSTGSDSGLLREGLRVKLTLDTGAEYEGTYISSTDSTYTLKMVTPKRQTGSEMSNGTAKSGRENGNMSFQKENITDILVTGAALPNKDNTPQNGGSSFRTDTAISGNKAQGERPLQRWIPEDSPAPNLSLGSGAMRGNDGAGWDQFAVNEQLFGVKTSYDENIYTTAIDKSHPEYNKRYAQADKAAREIERSTAFNAHVAEERVRDNFTVGDNGLDEEDKYSGVQRQDFPPLAPTGRPEKYMHPGRRINSQQPAAGNGTSSGIHSDPAIISSQLARKSSPINEKEKLVESSSSATKSPATETPTDPAPDQTVKAGGTTKPEASVSPVRDVKAGAETPSTSASRTASPQTRAGPAPNATATVERDVVSAFKGFAAQQRSQADKLRVNKAKADKADKLSELKRFAANFKLESPVPSDLVAIIAKDPAKQKEIQEKSIRNAEIIKQEKLAAKSVQPDATKAAPQNSDPKINQKSVSAVSQAPISLPGAQNRQNSSRGPSHGASGPSSRTMNQGQGIPGAGGRPQQGGLGQRLRVAEQNRGHQQMYPMDYRQPPTGPAHGIDSRRSSGANMSSAKLNPSINEFRPNAPSFTPISNRSTGSSPRSNSVPAQNPPMPAAPGSLIRRRDVAPQSKPKFEYNIIEKIASIKITPELEKKWKNNDVFRPSFDTTPTWRQMQDEEPLTSTMHLSYTRFFELEQNTVQPVPSHTNPAAAHQHQLPFHLQQNNMGQRHSPRQHPMHVHHGQHSHGPNTPFNPEDQHRMMASHSAQGSYASPRPVPANMVFPSPMGGPNAQLAYGQQGMQFPMGPGGPQQMNFNRSYSGGHFIPQQGPPHMVPPMMTPAGGGFLPQPNMIPPGSQIGFGAGQPHFIPPSNGMPIPGANGYSPGRGTVMMHQGSHQGSQPGQPAYGMSPGMQFNPPVYQQPPAQMSMRYNNQPQQYGTSPQTQHQFAPNRGGPNGAYNRNFQHQQHAPHPAQHGQHPTGPPTQVGGGSDDAK